MDAHTHTPTHTRLQTEGDFQSRLGREKIIKRFKFQQKVKKKLNKYSSENLLEETMKKRSTQASETHLHLMAAFA